MTVSAASSSVKPRVRSGSVFSEALGLFPGGVNSPVRAFGSVGGGTPLIAERAEGVYLWDADGNRYLDLVGSWGPAILGHAHPEVIAAVCQTAQQGLGFGCPTALENQLGQAVRDAFPSMERLRFVSSGTEAAMSAIRLARAYTKRNKLIKFEGCYHGHADFLLVKAGSGAATYGVPDSAGVPEGVAQATLTARYNDLDSVKALFEAHPNQIAGVAIEPIAGNMGCIPPEAGFLEGLRQLCDEQGALLLMDEVMTGFRVAYGGAQQLLGVKPDITMLGKIVGGGMPVGAYGASEAIMAQVSPIGPMYQAGTLSGHPLGMAAGLKTLTLLKEPGVYDRLRDQTEYFAKGLRRLAEARNLPVVVRQAPGMISLFFQSGPVRHFQEVLNSDKDRFKAFFWHLFERGIYWAPSPFEACFLSLQHTPEVIDSVLSVVDSAFEALAAG
jgi:glutamate-1-semialdehyde 2,1-aminomutase